MKTSRLILLLCAVSVISSGLMAQGDSKMLAKIDAQVNFFNSDFAGQYSFLQESSDSAASSKTAMVFRRDTSNSWLIILVEPASEKGKAYLKSSSTMWWVYDPSSKRFTFTNAEDRFQDLNVRNSDFSRSTFADEFKVVATSQEKLGKYNCKVLSLEATVKSVTFPHVKIWVSEDLLVRKRQDFSLSDELIRTTAIPQYQKVGEHFVPMKVIILDELKGKTVNGKFINDRTTIEISKPALQKFNDAIFTKAYLEKLGT